MMHVHVRATPSPRVKIGSVAQRELQRLLLSHPSSSPRSIRARVLPGISGCGLRGRENLVVSGSGSY